MGNLLEDAERGEIDMILHMGGELTASQRHFTASQRHFRSPIDIWPMFIGGWPILASRQMSSEYTCILYYAWFYQ